MYMDELVFSVIVTAYNQPEEIKRAVESVLNQTIKCFELIVVDDCSTDETPEILEQLSKNNPEKSVFKIIRHQKNSSSHAARCTGVENANGQYIVFLDGDDYLVPDALEQLLTQVIEPQKDDFDVCEFSYDCQPEGKIIKPSAEIYKSIMPDKSSALNPIIDYFVDHDSPVTVWNKLYKSSVVKEAFKNMQTAYIRCGDDTYETICIAYFTKKYIQKDILVINYQLDNGVSLRKNNYESNKRHCESLKTSLDCLKAFFEKNEYSNKTKLLNNVEQRYFDWILSVMKNNTEFDDITRSLILLPKYFNEELIYPHFKKLYSKPLLLKKIKLFIHKIFSIFDITLLKFLIVGVINTIVGCGIMFAFYNLLGFSYWISSASNYIVGGIVSYFLNKFFTFKNKEYSFKQILSFIINLLICYFIAYYVAKKGIYFLLSTYSETVKDNVSMLCGMVLYTGLNFLGQKFIVFKNNPKGDK